MTRPLHTVALVKQVPRAEELVLGRNGRLARTGVELELNPYCRRAVAKAVQLARDSGGICTVVTLGPPAAEDCLREAIACGAGRGVLVTDPAFAGSDTLATARALTAALRRLGPFDLVLCGRNSVDAETGQTPAQVAELLGLPVAASVRRLAVEAGRVRARCENDDGWVELELPLPALVSCAERLIAPAKASRDARAAVPAERIARVGAAGLGPGPWGQDGSRTVVGRTRTMAGTRLRLRFPGDLGTQVERAVATLTGLGAFDRAAGTSAPPVPDRVAATTAGAVAVLTEPGRGRHARAMLGAAARIAAAASRPVTALATGALSPAIAGSWGADTVVAVNGATVAEDVAAGIAAWCAEHRPWALLAPSTLWGREVAARVAARLGLGLAGDAVDVETGPGGELVCWKPAFSGSTLAAVTCAPPTRVVTLRGGALPLLHPRVAVAAQGPHLPVPPGRRVRVVARERDDDVDVLAVASAVVGVGAGVPPADYPLLGPLLEVLGADLAATRKVTDRGWLPRARQVGVTGRSVAPRLYVAIGTSGKFNHLCGTRGAGFVLGINTDPAAPLFDAADVGIVGDWREVVPRLTTALTRSTLPEPIR
ncbi:FAD-binding protein [Amycolatopsis sp. CA-128772]|uniref:FAD-binding protein n=1 Tax=Amycolatopsis sp. CA-128772 TaxID=2073159 RepID=UPI0013050512|nr:FAD-binding protein [Amycolatopsis sp. CA-128772]